MEYAEERREMLADLAGRLYGINEAMADVDGCQLRNAWESPAEMGTELQDERALRLA